MVSYSVLISRWGFGGVSLKPHLEIKTLRTSSFFLTFESTFSNSNGDKSRTRNITNARTSSGPQSANTAPPRIRELDLANFRIDGHRVRVSTGH